MNTFYFLSVLCLQSRCLFAIYFAKHYKLFSETSAISHSTAYLKNFFFFTFFDHSMVKKVLFWVEVFETDILTDLHVLRSPENENRIFTPRERN